MNVIDVGSPSKARLSVWSAQSGRTRSAQVSTRVSTRVSARLSARLSRRVSTQLLSYGIASALTCVFGWLLMVPFSSSSARADIATINATRDATLYEAADGSIANGAGQSLFAGRTGQNKIRRALISFDIASILPEGATITAARLNLNLSQLNGGARNVSIHRALSAWTSGASDPTDNEGSGTAALVNDATWLHSSFNGAGGGAAWSNVGGDFSSTASATLMTEALGLYTWSSADLLEDVRFFALHPELNFGWAVLGDEASISTSRRFDSADSAIVGGVVPTIEVEYSFIPSPGAFALLLAAGYFAQRRARS